MPESSVKLFTNANVYTPDGVFEGASLLVRDGMIESIIPAALAGSADTEGAEIIDVGGANLVPGFVDVHVHGGGGFDVMSSRPGKPMLDGMSLFHAKHGTTAFLATTLTASKEDIDAALQSLAQELEAGTSGADAVGIHLEGPFINPVRCGAQNPAHIREATVEEMKKYMDDSGHSIRLMTIAPEFAGNLETIAYATQNGVTASIGHSDGKIADIREAVAKGASHVTHMFNGMSPMHHREPGVAGSALLMDELAVELIVDGIHMTPDIVSLVYKTKPADKIVLITDAIEATGCPDGDYFLGELPIIVKDNKATLRDGGSLAGSTLTMDRALRNTIAFTGLSLESVLPGLTLNPARQVGIDDRKGSIEAGKDADLVILDADLNVKATYVRGRNVFQA
ncbi:N-acetylglucosamine-6-phosphate deacetylase [Paenibacillus sp. MBLB4367]|uniref:N-acetylglucosamine-6-phosphate deacetylase n=1 Tax=Paenibacillus sp. MBLB4367 TaxID=3384767 RepID=UPI003907FD81